MKQHILSALILGLTSFCVLAKFQPPDIEWQQSFGGTNRDGIFGFAETSDRGFVLGGFSSSLPGGNKTSTNYGGTDYWVIRLDSDGNKLWEKTYGGSSEERISKILIQTNGDVLLAGYSNSTTNSVKTAPRLGNYDYWLVKIDSNGNKLWDKTYGGTLNDYLEVITATTDSGFLLGGQSFSSTNGTKTALLKTQADYWLVKVDADGNQLWDKSYGGTGSTTQSSLEIVQPTSDGDFILAGWSASQTGNDKTAAFYGSLDWWLLRIDSSGNKIWDQSYGGTGYETVWGVRESLAGSFLVGGLSASTNGHRTSDTFGSNDYWITRINGNGSMQWEKNHGGTGLDDCRAFVPTPDGGGLFCGKSASAPGGNKESSWHGDHDFWAVRVNAGGEQVWEMSMGGSKLDDPFYMIQTSDGGYLIGGWSDSPVSGNKTSPNYGERDIWMMKLKKERHQLAAPARTTLTSGFEFSTSGLSNVYVAEFSTNLVDWHPFQTNEISVLTGVIPFFDATNAVGNARFYRTRQLQE